MMYQRKQEPFQWENWPLIITVKPNHFRLYSYKINGIQYDEESRTFREALDKAYMWEKLSD